MVGTDGGQVVLRGEPGGPFLLDVGGLLRRFGWRCELGCWDRWASVLVVPVWLGGWVCCVGWSEQMGRAFRRRRVGMSPTPLGCRMIGCRMIGCRDD